MKTTFAALMATLCLAAAAHALECTMSGQASYTIDGSVANPLVNSGGLANSGRASLVFNETITGVGTSNVEVAGTGTVQFLTGPLAGRSRDYQGYGTTTTNPEQTEFWEIFDLNSSVNTSAGAKVHRTAAGTAKVELNDRLRPGITTKIHVNFSGPVTCR